MRYWFILLSLLFIIPNTQSQPIVPLGVQNGDSFSFELTNYYYEHKNLGFEINRTNWELGNINISIGDQFQISVVNDTPSFVSGADFFILGIEMTKSNQSQFLWNHLSEFGFISHLDIEQIEDEISTKYQNLNLNETFEFSIYNDHNYFGYEIVFQDEINYRYGNAIYDKRSGVAVNIEQELILDSFDSEEYVYQNLTRVDYVEVTQNTSEFKISIIFSMVFLSITIRVVYSRKTT